MPTTTLDLVAFLQEAGEVVNARTGRVAHDQAGGQVDDGRAVLDHFLARVLYIPARAAAAGREPDEFRVGILVHGEGAFPVPQGAQTLAARAGVVPVADDDADTNFFRHGCDPPKDLG